MTLPFNIDLAEVKDYLGYDEADESRDSALNILIKLGVAVLKDITGRNLVYGTYRDTFTYEGCYNKFYLKEIPIESVQSVKVGDTELDPADYDVYLDDGLVYVKAIRPSLSQYGIAARQQFLKIVYTGGYETLADDLYAALLAGVQAIDASQRLTIKHGGTVQSISVQDVGSVTYMTGRSLTSTTTMLEATIAGLLSGVASATDFNIGVPNLHTSEFLVGSPS